MQKVIIQVRASATLLKEQQRRGNNKQKLALETTQGHVVKCHYDTPIPSELHKASNSDTIPHKTTKQTGKKKGKKRGRKKRKEKGKEKKRKKK